MGENLKGQPPTSSAWQRIARFASAGLWLRALAAAGLLLGAAAGAQGLPDLAPIAFQAPSLFTGPSYTNVTFVWAVTNQGSLFCNWWSDAVYLSTDSLLDANDRLLGYGYQSPVPFASGQSYWVTNSFQMPL